MDHPPRPRPMSRARSPRSPLWALLVLLVCGSCVAVLPGTDEPLPPPRTDAPGAPETSTAPPFVTPPAAGGEWGDDDDDDDDDEPDEVCWDAVDRCLESDPASEADCFDELAVCLDDVGEAGPAGCYRDMADCLRGGGDFKACEQQVDACLEAF